MRAGEVHLNRDDDEDFFEKIKLHYTLKNSPLIGLFTVADEAEKS